MLRSLFFYCSMFIVTLVCSSLAILAALIFRSSNKAHLVARLWGRTLLFLGGVRVDVEGLEKIDPNQAYIFAANHQSQFDIFALLGHLPVQFRWLAKIELFRIPIFGAAMKGAGYIPIDRADRRKAFKSIDQAAAKVRQGTSIVIFPEGTRSLDGKLKGFKKGGFHLAIKSQRPIVPVSISGTFSILPKRGFRINPRAVRIHLSEPIPTASLTGQDRNWLISTIRQRIQENLPPEEEGERGP